MILVAPPSTSTLKKPHTAGLYATRQFYISSKHQDDEYEIQLGVWHILPNYIAKKFSTELNLNEVYSIFVVFWGFIFLTLFIFYFQRNLISLIEARSHDKQEFAIERIQDELKQKFPVINEKNEQEFYETTLKQDETRVLVYFHGNTGSRAAGHRVELYKLLRDLGFHVITFDYRSYGDSTSATMTEAGVVRDALNVYKYAAAITKGPIFVWGHSLGTGVLTHLMTIINKSNETLPKMVVLESPFNNIWDEVREHPLSRLFRHLPWFDVTVSHPMFQNNLRFQSDKNIAQIHQPIAIIHAQDDLVVPFKLGYKVRIYRLYEICTKVHCVVKFGF